MSSLMDALAASPAPVTASTPDNCAISPGSPGNVVLLPGGLGGPVSQEITATYTIQTPVRRWTLTAGPPRCRAGTATGWYQLRVASADLDLAQRRSGWYS